jgi:oxalate decarboxylase/phosphoglucose isomerase-like protein (cupin superfamily)
MKLHIDDIGGEVVKEDDRYIVKDNKTLNNLVVSSTDLKPGCATNGHKHIGQEEVYYFIRGSGKMELVDTDASITTQNVSAGDVVLIPDGWYHKVSAGLSGCYFVCVFDGIRRK